jgi:hypothetical protein
MRSLFVERRFRKKHKMVGGGVRRPQRRDGSKNFGNVSFSPQAKSFGHT